MAEFLVGAAIAILVPAALALLLDRFWPCASTRWLALCASLALPLVLALLFALVYRDSTSSPPNPEHMNDSLVPPLAVTIGPIVVALAWAFGFPAAFETLERRRRNRAP